MSVRSRRASLALTAACALGALAGTAPAALAQEVPRLSWTACEDGFECATAEVPRDYRRPGGATLELALIRLPATDRERRIGSLFVNPGGPGGSGVDFVRAAAESFEGLNDRFDIVGFDPRGVGASQPAVDCAIDQETEGPYAQPFTRPTRESEAALLARTEALIQRCLDRNRGILPYLSTANVVRDLDLLRRAVHDERLSYLGFSYGTLIGATYASLFPNRARALALDGAVDAEDWLNRPTVAIREQTQGFERALGRFFQACAAEQAACGFGGTDPWSAYDELAERLDRAPIPAGGGEPVDGDDLRAASLLALYAKQFWPLLAAGLAGAEAGDGTIIRLLTDALYGKEDDGTFSPAADQFLAIAGLEARREGPAEFYLEVGRQAYGLFDHFWFNNGYGDLPFGLWPVQPRGVFRGPFTNAPEAAPALVVGTTYDPATPYIWARRLTADLGNARLLTMRGDGHTAFGGNSACIDAAVEAYLEEGALPAEGTVCRQEVPFAAAAAARSRARAGMTARTARRMLRDVVPHAKPVVGR